MEISKYADEVLNIYNYYNGAIIVDRKGIIEYYFNNRTDINTIVENDIIGKSLFDIYSSISPETSTLMEVMRTGQPILNTFRRQTNYKGEEYGAICSTFPISSGDQIIGAIEIFWYMEERSKYLNIFLAGTQKGLQNKRHALDDIVSTSGIMQELKEKIIKVAGTSSTIMISGETGTGKELVGQAIHSYGSRSQGLFISQNCASIPENLLESILFGTVKGAFTGAENRTGLFEATCGGTLMLDEINSMDPLVQAKLLRAIEEQRIVRVGGTEEIPVDVRIIAVTNNDPIQCVKEGQIREDLYYRLNVVRLNVPPLRKRKEDIIYLTDHYMDFFNKTMDRKIQGISDSVMEEFYRYDWPGNVRELRNMIERGFNLCEGHVIEKKDLDMFMFTSGSDLKSMRKNFEKHIIQEALNLGGTYIDIARSLGITRQTLNNKMKEYKLYEGVKYAEVKRVRSGNIESI